MEPLASLHVICASGSPCTLNLTSDYFYWLSNGMLKSYNTSDIIGLKSEDCYLTLITYKHLVFKFTSFRTISDPTLFHKTFNELLFPEPKCFLILYNPSSGAQQSLRVLQEKLLPLLSSTLHTYEVLETFLKELPDDIMNGIGEKFKDFIILGGDGTLHTLLTEIHKKGIADFKKLTFGILPTGSRNSLAVELNGRSLEQSIASILKGRKFSGDLLKIRLAAGEVIATTAINWGFGAEVPYEAEKHRRLGHIRFILIGLKAVFTDWKPFPATFTYQDSQGNVSSRTGNFLGICVGNNRAQSSHNGEIPFPHARINSGYCDGMLLDMRGRVASLKMFMQMASHGAHLKNPIVSYVNLVKAKLVPKDHFLCNIDGEFYQSDSIEIEIMPKSTNYYGYPIN